VERFAPPTRYEMVTATIPRVRCEEGGKVGGTRAYIVKNALTVLENPYV